MSRPANMDLAYYGKVGMRCAYVYFSIIMVAILALIPLGMEGSRGFILLGIVAVVFLFIPIGVLVRAARKYAIWKQWAEERGWEEPPKEKRAWVAK